MRNLVIDLAAVRDAFLLEEAADCALVAFLATISEPSALARPFAGELAQPVLLQ